MRAGFRPQLSAVALGRQRPTGAEGMTVVRLCLRAFVDHGRAPLLWDSWFRISAGPVLNAILLMVGMGDTLPKLKWGLRIAVALMPDYCDPTCGERA